MITPEILELLKQAKELGVKKVEINGMKFEFEDKLEASAPESVPNDQELTYKDLVAAPSPFDELTDEEVLYWSSEYGKELAEQRKADYEESLKDKRSNDLV